MATGTSSIAPYNRTTFLRSDSSTGHLQGVSYGTFIENILTKFSTTLFFFCLPKNLKKSELLNRRPLAADVHRHTFGQPWGSERWHICTLLRIHPSLATARSGEGTSWFYNRDGYIPKSFADLLESFAATRNNIRSCRSDMRSTEQSTLTNENMWGMSKQVWSKSQKHIAYAYLQMPDGKKKRRELFIKKKLFSRPLTKLPPRRTHELRGLSQERWSNTALALQEVKVGDTLAENAPKDRLRRYKL